MLKDEKERFKMLKKSFFKVKADPDKAKTGNCCCCHENEKGAKTIQ